MNNTTITKQNETKNPVKYFWKLAEREVSGWHSIEDALQNNGEIFKKLTSFTKFHLEQEFKGDAVVFKLNFHQDINEVYDSIQEAYDSVAGEFEPSPYTNELSRFDYLLAKEVANEISYHFKNLTGEQCDIKPFIQNKIIETVGGSIFCTMMHNKKYVQFLLPLCAYNLVLKHVCPDRRRLQLLWNVWLYNAVVESFRVHVRTLYDLKLINVDPSECVTIF